VGHKFAEPLSIDPETGLPKLPENFAWNVRGRDEHSVAVEVYYKHFYANTWWEDFRKKPRAFVWLKDKSVYIDFCGGTKEELLATTTAMYQIGHEKYLKYKDTAELIGLYPPKSIS
jgi:hypothetical protein